jgi:glucose-1-phosphate cytidylyltransferase
MDTLRDRQVLEEMMERGDTPWQLNANTAAVVNG